MFRITRQNGNYAILDTPYEVYEYIVKVIFNDDLRTCSYCSHHEAEEAQCWCEMADEGEEYDGGEFIIECVWY